MNEKSQDNKQTVLKTDREKEHWSHEKRTGQLKRQEAERQKRKPGKSLQFQPWLPRGEPKTQSQDKPGGPGERQTDLVIG
jgi:hypothetical protein